MYQYFMTSPIGKLRLVEDGGFIKEISLADVPAARLNSEGKIIKAAETYVGAATEKTEILAEAERQLREYFAGVRKSFDLPLKPDGTAFFKVYGMSCRKFPMARHVPMEISQRRSASRQRPGQSAWQIIIIRL